jgi:hypothetical protein
MFAPLHQPLFDTAVVVQARGDLVLHEAARPRTKAAQLVSPILRRTLELERIAAGDHRVAVLEFASPELVWTRTPRSISAIMPAS